MPLRYPAEYVRADTVAEAVDLLTDGADARVIAGGYSLVPQLKDGEEAPDRLVDIGGIDALAGVERADGAVRVGALTTHDRLATSSLIHEHAAALADATDSVGDFQARTRGTIAGNLVFADPKYDAPAAFLALGGQVVTHSPNGERTVDADDWFQGSGETAIDPDELVTEIILPVAERSGYVRTSEYSGYAIVGAAAALETADGVVKAARVAVNGAKLYPMRLPTVERALVGQTLDGNVAKQAAEAALSGIDPQDLLANKAAAGQYRLRLVRSYCKRAIERATADR